ncbi:hypothetical protein A0H81_02885 [Grifola frondosa]|uniref:Uncharacterized protein n=1 Tax=Grifola frondosa TaxID=5627 RepID=A0A1C7MKC3_GRIFR|nr:hypothetical protein A0H81_02885 [Grifola frondosa]
MDQPQEETVDDGGESEDAMQRPVTPRQRQPRSWRQRVETVQVVRIEDRSGSMRRSALRRAPTQERQTNEGLCPPPSTHLVQPARLVPRPSARARTPLWNAEELKLAAGDLHNGRRRLRAF